MQQNSKDVNTESPVPKSPVLAIECEVYSRVVGYYRPIQNWNKGKQAEFAVRHLMGIDNVKSK